MSILEEDEETGPELSVVEAGVDTGRLVQRAAESAGLKRRREPETVETQGRRRIEVDHVRPVRAAFNNSDKVAKEDRPPHLRDDEFFNELLPGEVSRELMVWEQVKAAKEANKLKMKKAEEKKRGGPE